MFKVVVTEDSIAAKAQIMPYLSNCSLGVWYPQKDCPAPESESGGGVLGRGSQPPPHRQGGSGERCKLPLSVFLHFIDSRLLFLAFQKLLVMLQPPNMLENVSAYTLSSRDGFLCHSKVSVSSVQLAGKPRQVNK